MSTKFCGFCEESAPDYWCEECELLYCQSCGDRRHRKGERRFHTHVPIVSENAEDEQDFLDVVVDAEDEATSITAEKDAPEKPKKSKGKRKKYGTLKKGLPKVEKDEQTGPADEDVPDGVGMSEEELVKEIETCAAALQVADASTPEGKEKFVQLRKRKAALQAQLLENQGAHKKAHVFLPDGSSVRVHVTPEIRAGRLCASLLARNAVTKKLGDFDLEKMKLFGGVTTGNAQLIDDEALVVATIEELGNMLALQQSSDPAAVGFKPKDQGKGSGDDWATMKKQMAEVRQKEREEAEWKAMKKQMADAKRKERQKISAENVDEEFAECMKSISVATEERKSASARKPTRKPIKVYIEQPGGRETVLRINLLKFTSTEKLLREVFVQADCQSRKDYDIILEKESGVSAELNVAMPFAKLTECCKSLRLRMKNTSEPRPSGPPRPSRKGADQFASVIVWDSNDASSAKRREKKASETKTFAQMVIGEYDQLDRAAKIEALAKITLKIEDKVKERGVIEDSLDVYFPGSDPYLLAEEAREEVREEEKRLNWQWDYLTGVLVRQSSWNEVAKETDAVCSRLRKEAKSKAVVAEEIGFMRTLPQRNGAADDRPVSMMGGGNAGNADEYESIRDASVRAVPCTALSMKTTVTAEMWWGREEKKKWMARVTDANMKRFECLTAAVTPDPYVGTTRPQDGYSPLAVLLSVVRSQLRVVTEGTMAMLGVGGLIVVREAIEMEVARTRATANLFRTDSPGTQLFGLYSTSAGIDYIRSTVGPDVQGCIKDAKNAFAPPSTDKLIKRVREVLGHIMDSVDRMPKWMREILQFVHEKTEEKFPGRGEQAIGAFFFLRMLAPAFATPESFFLVTGEPNYNQRKYLVDVSKVLVALANKTRFKKKHGALTALNPCLEDGQKDLSNFYESILQEDTTPKDADADVFSVPDNVRRNGIISISATLSAHKDQVLAALSEEQCAELTMGLRVVNGEIAAPAATARSAEKKKASPPKPSPRSLKAVQKEHQRGDNFRSISLQRARDRRLSKRDVGQDEASSPELDDVLSSILDELNEEDIQTVKSDLEEAREQARKYRQLAIKYAKLANNLDADEVDKEASELK